MLRQRLFDQRYGAIIRLPVIGHHTMAMQHLRMVRMGFEQLFVQRFGLGQVALFVMLFGLIEKGSWVHGQGVGIRGQGIGALATCYLPPAVRYSLCSSVCWALAALSSSAYSSLWPQ
jgi:hypothetical protein